MRGGIGFAKAGDGGLTLRLVEPAIDAAAAQRTFRFTHSVVECGASLPVPPLGYEPLCDAYIVHETCRLLNGGVKHEDGDRWTSATGLTAILSASPENINTLWQELRLDEIESGDQIPCMDLCLKLVEYLQGHGTCPPGSDISCYN
ncbi:unnamed protein product, partial [Effrenium voratum]